MNSCKSKISEYFFRFSLKIVLSILYNSLFSLYESSGDKSHLNCVFCPKITPISNKFLILFFIGSLSKTFISPSSTFNIPSIILIKVDFPAPFNPINPIV